MVLPLCPLIRVCEAHIKVDGDYRRSFCYCGAYYLCRWFVRWRMRVEKEVLAVYGSR